MQSGCPYFEVSTSGDSTVLESFHAEEFHIAWKVPPLKIGIL